MHILTILGHSRGFNVSHNTRTISLKKKLYTQHYYLRQENILNCNYKLN